MLNAYMIFSRINGSEEGAVLAFAHTAQEARVVGWRGIGSDLTDEYTDLAAKRLRNEPWLFDEANILKFVTDEAHVVDDPKACRICELWGQSPIGEDGLCEGCRQNVIDEQKQALSNCTDNAAWLGVDLASGKDITVTMVVGKCSFFGCAELICEADKESPDRMHFCQNHHDQLAQYVKENNIPKILGFWVKANGGAKKLAETF